MSEHLTYTIWLRWSKGHQAYFAEVPGLPGVQGSGKTYEEALASVLEAIRWWREKDGEGSSSPFSQMLMREPSETEEEPPETN
jgi:predicted RNase H-like HicB family nuclease